MREIKLFLPEGKDFMRWYEILHFKLTGGFSCTKCNAKSDFLYLHFNSTAHSKPVILQSNTPGICADCTRDELNQKSDIVFTEQDCKCDWCKETKPTMSFPRHDDLESTVIFGSNYWNGHHMCKACMNLAFGNRGPIVSTQIKHKDGKVFQRNALGLWIESK